jgi:hypothetical protein
MAITLVNTSCSNPLGGGSATGASFLSPAPTSSPLILNQLSVMAAAAYSLRLINLSFSGKCINVRRSSDNAVIDIGFVNGVLDTSTLMSFVGAGNGYIAIWYDQSGNGFNLVQSTAAYQPQIVSSGSLLTLKSLPTIQFGVNAATNTLLQATVNSVLTGLSNFTGNSIASLNGATSDGYGRILSIQYTGSANDFSSVTSAIPILQNAGGLTSIYSYRMPGGFLSNTSVTSAAATIFTSVNSGATSIIYANGTQGSTATNTGGAYALGSSLWLNTGNWAFSAGAPITGGGNDAFIGRQSELIVFPSALSSTDRQTLEHNQESYYSISGI